MEERIPRPGEIYNHFKDKPYQIITVATHSETGEKMVVYQALYGDFKMYVRPLEMFVSEVDKIKYPDVKQKYRFELRTGQEPDKIKSGDGITSADKVVAGKDKLTKEPAPDHGASEGAVNAILLEFLDANSYSKKLNVITGNLKHLNDRLINDMAVALDCSVEEGPLEERIQGLIFCLKAMCRFEDRRLR
jgi:hypothetical protein